MSVHAPRTSGFTFQSAVHSAHVLQCLNEQRLKDVLCDVTVTVEDRCFRGHCSVLASCSDYFHSRVANINRQNPIITLPDEVTVEGFEPLLQFAYTSKLLFTKENILAIHRSAEFLGFHNLETSCFDFLIPKLSEGGKPSQEDRSKACCQNSVPTVVSCEASRQPESRAFKSSLPSVEFTSQCPRSTQAAEPTGGQQFCLENCGPQMPNLSLSGVCPVLALQCQEDGDKADVSSQFCERDLLEIGSVCGQGELNLGDCSLPCELSPPVSVTHSELIRAVGGETSRAGSCDPGLCPLLRGTSGAQGGGEMLEQREAGQADSCDSGSCPLLRGTSGAQGGGEMSEQREAGLETGMAACLGDPPLPLSHEEGFGVARSSVEREVAEHLAKGFWPDLCASQTQPLPLDPGEHSDMAKAADFHWLKQLDLSSSTGDCPFLRELGAEEDQTPCTDCLSQSEKSPYISSSFNSGEDSELDSDGDDADIHSKLADDIAVNEVQLPFPVEQISTLSRSAFQKLLRHQRLTQEQLDYVHDIRRRSKNRVAAQRCRKRKLDSIYKLEVEINSLRGEKQRLMQERRQLEDNLGEMRRSLCALCKDVSAEPGTEQDSLQLFAEVSSPDVAISALLTPMSSPSAPGKEQENQRGAVDTSTASECVSECTAGEPAVNSPQVDVPLSNQEPEEGMYTQSCAVTSILSTCGDLNNKL